ncbi:competence protein ComK [Bacillus massiliglaciei]|uniref:competence protein ComK n=1 Tax=Bacillus massiliglaciei TaxID=1816693 RepID=UPI000A81CECE|nr:competence protein ComK [Bacillus massiliglaciei]
MKNNHQGLVEEYEITPQTLIVMPFEYGIKIYSRIIELEDDFISPFRPLDTIKKSCEYFGSSYDGRKQGTKQLIGITHKAPIAIDPTNSIFFFPTTSAMRPQCVWISHEHVKFFKRLDSRRTLVRFRNNIETELEISSSSFENQLHRTAYLKSKLNSRIEETRRRALYSDKEIDSVQASEHAARYRPGM